MQVCSAPFYFRNIRKGPLTGPFLSAAAIDYTMDLICFANDCKKTVTLIQEFSYAREQDTN